MTTDLKAHVAAQTQRRLLDGTEALYGVTAGGTQFRATPGGISNVRPYIYQATPANLGKFSRQLSRLLQQTSDYNLEINFIGDSITLGTGGGASGANAMRNSIPRRVKERFEQLGVAAFETKLGIHSSAAATATLDPRFAFTGTWGAWTALAGGNTFRCTSASGTLTYTPGYASDTCRLLWYRNTSGGGGGGNMIITVDGGATQFSTPTSGGLVSSQTISQSGTAGVQATVITFASAGNRTVTITNDVTGNIEIWGFEFYTAGTPTVIVRNLGISGYTSGLYNTGTIPTSLWQNGVIPADLTLICLGENDCIGATGTATLATNLAAIESAAQLLATSDVLYWTFPAFRTTLASEANQDAYAAQIITTASTDNVIVDIYQKFKDLGGYDALNGTSGGAWLSDIQHPSAVGNIIIANMLFDAMMYQQLGS